MRKRTILTTLAVVAGLMTLGPGQATASPGTLWVNDDAPVGGNTSCTDPGYALLSAAVAAAVDGDTIMVCPGTYVETQVNIDDKSLTIDGIDRDTTIIDGGNATGLAQNGTITSTKDTSGTTTIQDLTIKNFGDRGGSKIALFLRGRTTGVTFLVENLRFKGSNSLAVNPEFGFYTIANQADLTIQNSIFEDIRSNPLLFENQGGSYAPGPTHVLDNMVEAGLDGSSAYFSMTYGGKDVTALQEVWGNSIDATTGGGIVFNASPSFLPAASRVGKYTDVEVTDNAVSNLGTRSGIDLRNEAVNGADGKISDALIEDNTVAGTDAAGSVGVRLRGLIEDADIHGNSVSDVDTSLSGEAPNGHMPLGTEANFNNIFSNVTGLDWSAVTNALDAECNWWGHSSGPTTATNPPGQGDGITDPNGAVDYRPWLNAPAPGGACTVDTPPSAAACKKDGWMAYTDDQGNPFKNQGDCTSYVATGGRNKADG